MIYSRNISIEDREALEIFYRKAYPQRKDIKKYLDSTLFSLPLSQIKDSLIICDDDKIIGVNLCISTKAMINNEEYDIVWSYDTLVLPDYRTTDAGTFIVEFWYKRKDIFGAGLSEISEKMSKVMKSKFIAYATAYIKFNLTSRYLINLIRPIFPLQSVYEKEFPLTLSVQDTKFQKINSPEDFVVPESGYWNNGIIEFKRDIDFIAWRFFQSDSRYTVYQEIGGNVYFACRIIEWHNIPLLYIVDYRFDLAQIEVFNDIIDGALILMKKLNCAGLYIRCSLEPLREICEKRHFLGKGQGAQIVTRFKPATKGDYPVFFTAADSDMDFK